VNHDEKMDSIQLEYTYLLTSQLESQRRYFEEKISRVEENTQREIDDMVAQTRYELITCFHEFCNYEVGMIAEKNHNFNFFLLFNEVQFLDWDHAMEKLAVYVNKRIYLATLKRKQRKFGNNFL
jgi:hypothetical protein